MNINVSFGISNATEKQMPRKRKDYNGWTKEHIQYLLATNDLAVERGLVQIYNRQTAYEQSAKETQVHNGIGFSAFDGEFLSELAVKKIQYGRLTERQMQYARKKMMKYWKQLLEIAAQSGKRPTFDPPKPQANTELELS